MIELPHWKMEVKHVTLVKNGERGMSMSRFSSARNYIIGILIGVSISYTFTAYGEDISKIGHKVQGEYKVVINGTALNQKAVGVDGSTYAPLRAIGEATGYDVTFKDSTVYFTEKKGADSVPVESTATPTDTTTITTNKPKPSQMKLDMVNGQIESIKEQMQLIQKFVDGYEESGKSDDPLAAGFRKNLSDLQSQLDELEKQKAELESQLNK